MISLHIAVFVSICMVVGMLLYISIVQYRRAENALKIADNLLQNMNIIQDFIKEATDKMDNPRLKQAFESDDEIGFFFKQLEEIQETLATFLPSNEETVTDIE